MGRQTGFLFGLNAGVLSREAIQRVDQSAARVAGEVQENLLPRVLGAAMLRPGTGYVTRTKDDRPATLIPFIFSADEKALIELVNDGTMRVIVEGNPVSRVSVSTAITNGSFGSDLTGWTTDDETGATSDQNLGALRLIGTGTNRAVCYQEVTVSGPDTGVEHALRIEVGEGPVTFYVGTSAGAHDVVTEQQLLAGFHSLAFTPTTGSVFIHFASAESRPVTVRDVNIESSGDMVLPTPWNTIEAIESVQYDQSGDVVFLGWAMDRPRRIERRSDRSWSIVIYEPLDGPFALENTTTITLTPTATNGRIDVTASRPLFHAGHASSLWRLVHSQSLVSATVAGQNQWTDPIRVSGYDLQERTFSIVADFSNDWDGVLTLQRSFGVPGNWLDYRTVDADSVSSGGLDSSEVWMQAFDKAAGKIIEDEDRNQIIYYRIGIRDDPADYTTGSANVGLFYTNAPQDGVVRVVSVTSPTEVRADVLVPLGSTDPTATWNSPEWHGPDRWPGSVTFFDGRLWWGGRDRVFGSVSDAFASFDDRLEGDAGTINRSIATGAFERVLWLAGLQRLLCGTATQEVSIRSSAFDEPVTPTQFTARTASRQGSASGRLVERVDSACLFVHRNLKRVYELVYMTDAQDYVSRDLTRLVPEMCEAGVRSMAVQRQPDTRVWFVLEDGNAACLLYERQEDAIAWVDVTMSGNFEGVAVLPGTDEDEVYFVVRRTIDDNTVRTIEKLAMLTECVGGTVNKNCDSHVVYSGGATTTISGLDHLEGREVVVWADGAAVNDQDDMLTVSSGAITLDAAASNVVVGLPYNGRFRSVNLDYGSQLGVSLGKPQKIVDAKLLLKDTAWKGVRIGTDFSRMRAIPATYEGRPLDPGEILADATVDVLPGGGFSRRARLCLSARAPYPATFLGVAFDIETGEGIGSTSRQGE